MLHPVKIVLVTVVGRADQRIAVPGNDEKGALIGFGFDIDCRVWRASKARHNQMTALGAANQSWGGSRQIELYRPTVRQH